MKLRHSHTSPFVRKVMMTALEAGVADRIEAVPTDVWSRDTTIGEHNPLGKVPTLVLDDGTTLYDSPVICEYLDSLNRNGAHLFPPPGPARWTALTQQALGDGICDAAVAWRLESRRPEGEMSPSWIERQKLAVTRGCDVLEASVDELSGPVTIGTLAAVTALAYLDLRFEELNWRATRPKLAAWFLKASARPSFEATRPVP
jgi:glutathione S-transferase